MAGLSKEDKERIEQNCREWRANWTPQDDVKYGTLKEAMGGMICDAERNMIDKYREAGVSDEELKEYFELL